MEFQNGWQHLITPTSAVSVSLDNLQTKAIQETSTLSLHSVVSYYTAVSCRKKYLKFSGKFSEAICSSEQEALHHVVLSLQHKYNTSWFLGSVIKLSTCTVHRTQSCIVQFLLQWKHCEHTMNSVKLDLQLITCSLYILQSFTASSAWQRHTLVTQ